MDFQMDTEMNTSEENYPPAKQKKTGYNINNFIDIGAVVKDFVNIYFTKLSEKNIQNLIDCKIIREYSSIKFNDKKMKGQEFLDFLSDFTRYNINVNTYNYIDSGSRRIDISVIGNMKQGMEVINFNQTFILCNQDESWYIKNSIFLTF